MSDIAPAPKGGDNIMEQVIIKGDLAKLTPDERWRYYVARCESVGLNPLSQPFEYIPLNGKLVLYAGKGCAEQLRKLHGVSVEEMTESVREGVCIVTCKVRGRDGRTDVAKGAVSVGGLKGDPLCNAIMRAETKAKRRATLSLCGLGMLDESELETIPQRNMGPAPAINPLPVYDPETGEVEPDQAHLIENTGDSWIDWGTALMRALKTSRDLAEMEEWVSQNEELLHLCEAEAPKVHARLTANIVAARERLDPG